MPTYPLDIPDHGNIERMDWATFDAIGVSQSPFTRDTEIFEHDAEVFSATVYLHPMTRIQWAEWISMFLKLKGRAGTFLLGDPIGLTARGSASTSPGTPLVQGAGQTGRVISIDGCPNSATDYLMRGDYIAFGSGLTTHMAMVVNNVDTNGSGHADVTIWPSVNTALVNNSTVIVDDVKGLFRMSSNRRDWSLSGAADFGVSFDVDMVPV